MRSSPDFSHYSRIIAQFLRGNLFAFWAGMRRRGVERRGVLEHIALQRRFVPVGLG